MKQRNLFKRFMIITTLLFLGFSYQSNAQTMMPIPAHSSVYTGQVRGYWFIAPTDFTITGLRVPPEAGTSTQSFHILKIHSGGVPVYPTMGTNFSTLFYTNGVANNTIQSVSIPVSSGDTIGIFGQAGTSVSYGVGNSPVPSTINGLPVDLTRLIHQGSINVSQATDFAQSATGIGRVEMYYTTAACTGQPTAGTVPATVETCPSQSFSIQATGATAEGSMANRWQESPSGQNNWTDVAGANMSTFTSSGITTATDYRYITTCTPSALSDTSSVVAVSISPANQCYCIPVGASNNGDEIRNFTLENLDNDSGPSEGTNGYSDYTQTVTPADLLAGLSYTASLTSGTGSGNHGAAIWIDYNENGVFEASEKVAYIASSIGANTTVDFPSFLVPNNPGTYRLRVQYTYSQSGNVLDPCVISTGFAETEDYMVNVLPPPSCLPPNTLVATNVLVQQQLFHGQHLLLLQDQVMNIIIALQVQHQQQVQHLLEHLQMLQ